MHRNVLACEVNHAVGGQRCGYASYPIPFSKALDDSDDDTIFWVTPFFAIVHMFDCSCSLWEQFPCREGSRIHSDIIGRSP